MRGEKKKKTQQQKLKDQMANTGERRKNVTTIENNPE